MKKTVTVIISVLLVFTLMFSLAGCGAKGKIKGTIKNFQKACNELNVEAAVDCLDSSIAGILKLGAGLLGGLTGKGSDEVFEGLSDLLGSHADSFGVESFKTLKIKVNDVAANENTADAKVTLTYNGLSGEEKSTDATLELKNSSEGWKISGVRFS